ncbi:hypothetical protein BDW02DRAFT_131655 [Decorospora gaudefroyi]|uniref:Uncharacterized protein n=1 Tax=Decorospora gaudefroyi TaxID=184978 RepID=A0A6A5KNN3_9PLEO|nr:hypothetical protein BDW02DRAFT_131655 [Decorospora gaudefroyi]
MPAFLRRLTQPLLRPTHYNTVVEPPPTSSELASERQKAEDQIENDLDDGYDRRLGPSDYEVPIILARGKYGPILYPRKALSYNSTMRASDSEPPYVCGYGQRVRHEVQRSPVRRHFHYQEGQKPYPKPEPREHLTPAEDTEILRRWRDWNEKYMAGKRPAEESLRRPESREHLATNWNGENLRRPRAQNEKHIGVRDRAMRAEDTIANHTLSPRRPPSPPRGPITPGSPEWDTFMDFPSENSRHMQDENNTRVDTSRRGTPATAVSEASTLALHEGALSTRPAQATPPRPQPETKTQQSSPSTLPGISPTEPEERDELTWNLALNRILGNEAVDPAMKAAVRERVQRSSTTNGSGHADTIPVAAVDVGLVPNFSYPIYGSAFYDRLAPKQAPQARSSRDIGGEEGAHVNEGLLPSGVSHGHCSPPNSSDPPHHYPTLTTVPASPVGGPGESERLTNGVPPGYFPDSSSSDSSYDLPRRAPTPPDNVPDQVFILLCSLLTPSELSLHHNIINGPVPPRSPPSPVTVPPSNAASTTPLDERLVQKLYTAVYGLQDRVTGLKEDLIPQISNYLEQKHNQVEELSLEVLNLRDEIDQLKRIADFGNKILSGCWQREWETWRTLLDIRKWREAKRGTLSRLFSRRKDYTERDTNLLYERIPEGYQPQPQIQREALRSEIQKPIKTAELDALLLMAEQNVRIIREDMQDMLEMVQACQARAEVAAEVAPPEGSWRDV